MYPCPKCGKKDSSYDGEIFCGPCERAYRQEEEDWNQAEIARLQGKINAHGCQDDCPYCLRRVAQIASLQGNEAKATYLMNQ